MHSQVLVVARTWREIDARRASVSVHVGSHLPEGQNCEVSPLKQNCETDLINPPTWAWASGWWPASCTISTVG